MNSAIPNATALSQLFPDLKVKTGYELGDGVVSGYCNIYRQRSDTEADYAIQEIGVAFVPSGQEPTSAMVRQAIKDAREAAMQAMSELCSVAAGASLSQMPPSVQLAPPVYVQPVPVTPQEEPAPPASTPQNQDTQSEPVAPPVQEEVADGQEGENPDDTTSVSGSSAPVGGESVNTAPESRKIERLPFSTELFPASSLSKGETVAGEAPPAPETEPEPAPPPEPEAEPQLDPAAQPESPPADDPGNKERENTPGTIPVGDGSGEVDEQIAQAREVEITILGRAHKCQKWTAGRILDEEPQEIINMKHRYGGKYNGDKKYQLDAVETLYPEALRIVQDVSRASAA